MKAFSHLLDRLVYTRSRNAKVRLIADYLRATPDPDRGWALASITGQLDIAAVKPALIRTLVEQRVDPELFAMSHNYVGGLAETCSLIWPAAEAAAHELPLLGDVVDHLHALSRQEAPGFVADMMDRLDASGRYA